MISQRQVFRDWERRKKFTVELYVNEFHNGMVQNTVIQIVVPLPGVGQQNIYRRNNNDGKRHTHPQYTIPEIFPDFSYPDGVYNPTNQQAEAKRVYQDRVCRLLFNEIEQDQADWHIFGKIAMNPHGTQHFQITTITHGHSLPSSHPYGPQAERHKHQGQQGGIEW